MAGCTARRIVRIALTVGDRAAAGAFYEDVLGFRRLDGAHAFAADAAVDGQPPCASRLQLGQQQIELAAFDAPGRPYPQPRAANDPWFQHFAIAVDDMDAAYARLAQSAQQPISRTGPQRLPPSTGSVTAYKFRDPDGHPLELSLIPNSAWTEPRPRSNGPFLGIDHTALAVSDLQRSVAFYSKVLGLRVAERTVNQGPEQDRLDGLDGVVVDIASLTTAEPGPHIELLRYRSPRPPPQARAVSATDLAATRTILQVDSLAAAAELPGAARDGKASDADCVRLRDPDGHLLELCG